MLLHASKTAGLLTRAGGAIARTGRSLMRAPKRAVTALKPGNVLGSIGKTVQKHPMGTIALGSGAAMTGAGVAEGMDRASKGMEPPYPQQEMPGYYANPITAYRRLGG